MKETPPNLDILVLRPQLKPAHTFPQAGWQTGGGGCEREQGWLSAFLAV